MLVDGEGVSFDTRKAVALLAYLALEPGRRRRESLAALLWPDYSQDRARAALRRTLSVLRKGLGGRWLEVDRGSVQLPGEVGIDVGEFRTKAAGCPAHARTFSEGCAACASAVQDAVDMWRGEFLAGFSLRDSPTFDDWQMVQAESLRRELGDALERLSKARAARGDLDAALASARRWLALDELNESAHRRLMRLLTWKGDRTAALRQYRRCVSVLEEELGVAPLPETTELYEAILQDRPPPPPVPARRDEAVLPPPALPLVGRDEELRVLEDAHDRGRLIVVEGEAGVGKSRLAEEFAAAAAARGARVLRGRCYEGEAGIAYAPILGLLHEAWEDGPPDLDPDRRAEVARLLPGIGPPPDAPVSQARFLEALTAALGAAVDGPVPGVIVVDDLGWADEASLDVIAYLSRRLEGRPVCLVGVWRSEDVEAAHPLRALLAQAAREGRATHLSLNRLGPAEVTELVRAALPGSRPAELGERLYRETEGLPFFVVEYLAAAREGVPESLPTGVRELLRSRVASVSEVGRQVLTAAAVVGGEADPEVLRNVSGRSSDEVAAAADELVQRGLLYATQGGYAFTHTKIGELVYAEAGPARRRRLHLRAAEALGRSSREAAARAAAIARHLLAAGDAETAAEQFRVAGEHARRLFANAEALSHFREALALGHPDPPGLHEAIGDVLTLRGEYGEAVRSYEAAAAMAPSERIPSVEHKLGGVRHRRGDWDAASSHFEAALAGLGEGPPAARARLLADRSLNDHRRGRTEEAWQGARLALVEAETADDAEAVARARNIMGILSVHDDRLDQAVDHLELSLKAAEKLWDPAARVAALNNLALAHRASGDLDRAIELTRGALGLCARQGDRHREAALLNNLADLLRATGDEEAAMDHLKRAVGIFAEIGEPGVREPNVWKLVEW